MTVKYELATTHYHSFKTLSIHDTKQETFKAAWLIVNDKEAQTPFKTCDLYLREIKEGEEEPKSWGLQDAFQRYLFDTAFAQ